MGPGNQARMIMHGFLRWLGFCLPASVLASPLRYFRWIRQPKKVEKQRCDSQLRMDTLLIGILRLLEPHPHPSPLPLAGEGDKLAESRIPDFQCATSSGRLLCWNR